MINSEDSLSERCTFERTNDKFKKAASPKEVLPKELMIPPKGPSERTNDMRTVSPKERPNN